MHGVQIIRAYNDFLSLPVTGEPGLDPDGDLVLTDSETAALTAGIVDWSGIIGAFVMGLGTAGITLLVAIASVSLRESALAQFAGGPAMARTLALVETSAGGLVLALALQKLRAGF